MNTISTPTIIIIYYCYYKASTKEYQVSKLQSGWADGTGKIFIEQARLYVEIWIWKKDHFR